MLVRIAGRKNRKVAHRGFFLTSVYLGYTDLVPSPWLESRLFAEVNEAVPVS
jgi:hypothetical protein